MDERVTLLEVCAAELEFSTCGLARPTREVANLIDFKKKDIFKLKKKKEKKKKSFAWGMGIIYLKVIRKIQTC